MQKTWLRLGFALTLLLACSATLAQDFFGEDRLPTVDEAIQLVTDADWDSQQLLLDFELIDDVYLYQHRFGFSLRDQNGNVLEDFADYTLPPGKDKTDEIFGEVQVYYDRLSLTLPVASVPLVATELEVRYQGCIEDTLCYPPTKKVIPLANPAPAKKSPAATAATPAESPSTRNDDGGFLSTLQSEDANAFNRWMTDRSLGLIIGLFFVGGLLLAFTPCVFPMVPILSGIIAGEKEPSASRGFVLSTSYVLGMAVPYTLAGLLVAVFGAGLNLQVLLQQPAAIITSTVVFVLLALSMFGLYELQLPAFLRNKLHQPGDSQRGNLLGAAIMGTISALVVSPCVTPILAGALIYVAASGDAETARWVLDGFKDTRLRPSERLSMIAGILVTPETREIGYGWLKAHLDEMLNGAGGIFLAARLPSTLAGFCSVDQAKEFEALRPRFAGRSGALRRCHGRSRRRCRGFRRRDAIGSAFEQPRIRRKGRLEDGRRAARPTRCARPFRLLLECRGVLQLCV